MYVGERHFHVGIDGWGQAIFYLNPWYWVKYREEKQQKQQQAQSNQSERPTASYFLDVVTIHIFSPLLEVPTHTCMHSSTCTVLTANRTQSHTYTLPLTTPASETHENHKATAWDHSSTQKIPTTATQSHALLGFRIRRIDNVVFYAEFFYGAQPVACHVDVTRDWCPIVMCTCIIDEN